MNYSSPAPNRLEHVVRPAAAQSTRPKFAFRFQLLRVSDLSPVNAQRVAALDGKTVPCGKIVIGCEYAQDKFVVMRARDLKWIGALTAPGRSRFVPFSSAHSGRSTGDPL